MIYNINSNFFHKKTKVHYESLSILIIEKQDFLFRIIYFYYFPNHIYKDHNIKDQ